VWRALNPELPLLNDLIDDLRAALPPVWLGTRTDELTGGAIHWPTIQNERSRRKIPEECFARSGTRVLVIRDPFLAWWATTLSEARRPPVIMPPRRSRRRTVAEALVAGIGDPVDSDEVSDKDPAPRRRRRSAWPSQRAHPPDVVAR
jgi:hypothetical protein